jgi:hypothetical protein
MNRATYLLLISCMTVSLATAQTALADLVAQYAFDGNVNGSVGGFDGTVVGTAQYGTGVDGQAFNFDGSTKVTTTATASDLGIGGNNSKTITGWVYTRAFAWADAVFMIGDSTGTPGNIPNGKLFSLLTSQQSDGGDNKWTLAAYGAANTITFSYDSKDKWVAFAMVWDGSSNTLSAYMGGNLRNSKVISTGLATSDAMTLQIGAYTTGSSNYYFNGLVDDLRVYNAALDPSAIRQLATIPEPNSIVLLGGGLMGLLAYAWRKRSCFGDLLM